MAHSTSPSCKANYNKPPTGIINNNNNNKMNKVTSFSSRANISQAMLKAAKSFQGKMRKKKPSQSEPKPLKTPPLRKGKSYSSRSDREPRERNLEKHRERNFVFDTKIGARNFKTGFKTRKCYRLGSQKSTRRDRIYSVDSDSEDP